jgi:ribosomal protein L11 methylase PrmA
VARAEAVAGSFRDPSGFLFTSNGTLFRQVNERYRQAWEAFHASGLYGQLVKEELLVPHEEASLDLAPAPGAYRVIRPERIPFVSYPYEWCFSELQDAALTTLRIQEIALERGFVLKDASAYNVQFRDGRPIFIDTLSFEPYREGQPWVAYRQFCQHFLAPLALMACRDVRLAQLLRIYVDGIPLDLASRLLPRATRFRFGLLTHIHLHARSQTRHADDAGSGAAVPAARVSMEGLRGLIDSLRSAVRRLSWKAGGTEWGDYYEGTNYTAAASEHKAELVRKLLGSVSPATVWDLGGNTGVFSRIGVESGAHVVSWDVDPAAVEKNYRRLRQEGSRRLLPLLLDLTNPSGGVGWRNEERMSLSERSPVDLVMALALIHHLAISNNVPLPRIADFFASLSAHLLVEFVPKQDSQVKRLLATREDIFDDYTQAGFEAAFSRHYETLEVHPIPESERTLYLLRRING